LQWEGLGTSLVAVVVGNVAQDLDLMYQTVVDISRYYRHVVYVDGNLEHTTQVSINARRDEISSMFKKYRNITYLYRSTIILDSTAFIGSNGWCSYDFCEPTVSKQECFSYLENHGISQDSIFEKWEMAMEDSDYLNSTVNLCSRDSTVKQIVLVTAAVPLKQLAWLPNTESQCLLGEQGSSFLESAFAADVNSKINTWAFGRSMQSTDQIINKIRYVSNPRGWCGNELSQTIYYPKCIKNLVQV
jgi:hypothetical protein